MRYFFLVSVLAWLCAVGVHAQELDPPVQDCDTLAAEPGELPGIAGVADDQMDAATAAAACGTALQQYPGQPRFIHQYARALEQLGDIATALRLYQWGASDGYAPSVAALERLAPEVGADGAAATDMAATSAAAVDMLLAEQIAETGSDPAGLLSFVADAVGGDIYAGAMRGAAGTLLARSGSSADKALLLAALLRAADPAAEVRFASCTLTDEQSGTLLEAALTQRPVRPQSMLEAAESMVPHLSAPEHRAIVEGMAKIWTDAVDTVKRQADAIEAGFSAESAAPVPVPEAEMLQALANHYWVQRRDGENWTDFDPAMSGAAPGQALCAAETTSAEFPDAAMHHIEVQVVVEERTDGAPSETVVLDASAATPDLLSGGMTLMFAEAAGLDALVPYAEAPAGHYFYTPVLLWDTVNRVGEPVILPKPVSAPEDNPLLDAGALGDALGGVFGDEPEPEDAAEPRPENTVLGVWLRLASIAPDGTRVEATAPLFDRLGFANRSSQYVPDALPDLVEVDGEYQETGTVWDISVLDGRLGYLPVSFPDDGSIEMLVGGLRGIHSTYDLLRQSLYEAGAGTEAPRLVRTHAGFSLLGWIPYTGPDDVAGARYLMDVVLDGTVPVGGVQPNRRTAALRAASGVIGERLTVNFERLVLRLAGAEDVPAYDPIDVAALFDAAKAQDIRIVTAKDDLPAVASEEALARIYVYLEGGSVLLVPERPVLLGEVEQTAWWRLDPQTGLIYDEFENGRHQVLGEDQATKEPARKSAPWWRRFGERICAWGNRASGVLTLWAALKGDPGAAKALKYQAKVEIKVKRLAEEGKKAGRSKKNPKGGCSA